MIDDTDRGVSSRLAECYELQVGRDYGLQKLERSITIDSDRAIALVFAYDNEYCIFDNLDA